MSSASMIKEEIIAKAHDRPFKVGLDISALNPNFKAHAARGIGRYVRELSNYFTHHEDPNISVGSFEHDQVIGNGAVSKLIDLVPFGRTTLRQQIIYPLKLSNRSICNFDILHFPAHMDPPAWGMTEYIVTVLDLVPLVLSDLYKAANPNWRFKLARYLELKAITNASLILAISENTAQDVNRLLGVPFERIFVTPLGVDKRFFIGEISSEEKNYTLQKYNIPLGRDLVLYLGGIDPRKNMKGLIESFSLLKEKGFDNTTLVIVGQIAQDKQFPELLNLIRSHGLETEGPQKNVCLTGFMPDGDLLKLFSASKVFFFPSLYEGFGFTPLEAMAAGLPVVSSNRSSMPEVLGDAALLVDPTDPVACVNALAAVLGDKALHQRLSKQGPEQAARFTWERTGKETLKAYNYFSSTIKKV